MRAQRDILPHPHNMAYMAGLRGGQATVQPLQSRHFYGNVGVSGSPPRANVNGTIEREPGGRHERQTHQPGRIHMQPNLGPQISLSPHTSGFSGQHLHMRSALQHHDNLSHLTMGFQPNCSPSTLRPETPSIQQPRSLQSSHHTQDMLRHPNGIAINQGFMQHNAARHFPVLSPEQQAQWQSQAAPTQVASSSAVHHRSSHVAPAGQAQISNIPRIDNQSTIMQSPPHLTRSRSSSLSSVMSLESPSTS